MLLRSKKKLWDCLQYELCYNNDSFYLVVFSYIYIYDSRILIYY